MPNREPIAGRLPDGAGSASTAAGLRISEATIATQHNDATPAHSHIERQPWPANRRPATMTADAAMPTPTPAKCTGAR